MFELEDEDDDKLGGACWCVREKDDQVLVDEDDGLEWRAVNEEEEDDEDDALEWRGVEHDKEKEDEGEEEDGGGRGRRFSWRKVFEEADIRDPEGFDLN